MHIENKLVQPELSLSTLAYHPLPTKNEKIPIAVLLHLCTPRTSSSEDPRTQDKEKVV